MSNINVGASVKVSFENQHIKAVFPEVRKVIAKGKTGWIISGIYGPPVDIEESRLVLVEAGPEIEEIEVSEISKPKETKPKLTFGDPIPTKQRKRRKR